MKKRNLALAAVGLVLCLSVPAFAAETSDVFAGGSGAQEDPYVIENVD